MSEAMKLYADHGNLWIMEDWPPEVRLPLSIVRKWRKPDTEDIVDIRVHNGRGIYRLINFVDELWTCELVYQERDPAPPDIPHAPQGSKPKKRGLFS